MQAGSGAQPGMHRGGTRAPDEPQGPDKTPRTRLSSDVSEATEAEPAFEDTSDSDDTDAAMLATGTATPPLTATPPSATLQVSEHSADVNSARASSQSAACADAAVRRARCAARG